MLKSMLLSDFASDVVASDVVTKSPHEEAVVYRCDHEGPAHEDQAREGQGARHGEADLLRGAVVVHQIVDRQGPLKVRRPEVDVEGPRGVRRHARQEATAPLKSLLNPS